MIAYTDNGSTEQLTVRENQLANIDNTSCSKGKDWAWDWPWHHELGIVCWPPITRQRRNFSTVYYFYSFSYRVILPSIFQSAFKKTAILHESVAFSCGLIVSADKSITLSDSCTDVRWDCICVYGGCGQQRNWSFSNFCLYFSKKLSFCILPLIKSLQ